ncbi:unnamed protein product [Chrysodeixis includens]|uniref:Uncharacterized protein n=1 Tax=Chrysodeixis includens TaxID=689277 RepID=A0A9N8KXG9_CHRIL|nr:unnamed protein product [Chrysodeixis includens]
MDKGIKKKNNVNGKYKKNGKSENYRIDDDVITTCCLCVKTKKRESLPEVLHHVSNRYEGGAIRRSVYTLKELKEPERVTPM